MGRRPPVVLHPGLSDRCSAAMRQQLRRRPSGRELIGRAQRAACVAAGASDENKVTWAKQALTLLAHMFSTSSHPIILVNLAKTVGTDRSTCSSYSGVLNVLPFSGVLNVFPYSGVPCFRRLRWRQPLVACVRARGAAQEASCRNMLQHLTALCNVRGCTARSGGVAPHRSRVYVCVFARARMCARVQETCSGCFPSSSRGRASRRSCPLCWKGCAEPSAACVSS